MIYGYLRVSSDEQDVNAQKQGVVKFAEDHNWEINQFVTDEGVSGGKDPDKRNLGPLIKLLKKDDIIICSEISRLGRDLYMVMDILHFCMASGCKVYTVKDQFVLGDDIQSKVLAFAFGLSAEIERQMIRQRTREGLRLRMKLGVLVGRPYGTRAPIPLTDEMMGQLKQMVEWGVPLHRIAKNFKVTRGTVMRWIDKANIKNYSKMVEGAMKKARERYRKNSLYKTTEELCIVELPRKEVTEYIKADLTIPQIAEKMPQYTYDQIYDTILCDEEWNSLYRRHGQLKVRKHK